MTKEDDELSLGAFYRRVFEKIITEDFMPVYEFKWMDIQAGKKLNILGTWLVIYDTGAIIIADGQKSAAWLKNKKKWIEKQETEKLLEFLNN